MFDPDFQKQRVSYAKQLATRRDILDNSIEWMNQTAPFKYVYNWDWAGVPVIQFPQDLIALHEVIWKTEPDVIIETGVARGGSLLFSASMLALLDIKEKLSFDMHKTMRRVIGIDIDIRHHCIEAISSSPFSPMVSLVHGDSASPSVIKEAVAEIQKEQKVMVILDSCHSYQHVLSELHLLVPYVSSGCYLVVGDTSLEYATEANNAHKPWSTANSPLTAIQAYLASNPGSLEQDTLIKTKLLISSQHEGYYVKN